MAYIYGTRWPFYWKEDLLDGTDWADNIYGYGGDDTLYGRDGNDRLHGGDSDDRLIGGAGADQLNGNKGDNDVAVYDTSPEGVIVGLETASASSFAYGGHAEGDKLFQVENLVGSAHADHLFGNDLQNDFFARGGHDYVSGGQGNDRIWGEGGNDTLEGGAKADYLNGGWGLDTVTYRSDDEGVSVSLVAGNLATTNYDSHAYGDTFWSIENLEGTSHNDQLEGNGVSNRLLGLEGNDRLVGHGGNDYLHGQGGQDNMTGGRGHDQFIFANTIANGGRGDTDIITDFEPGIDTIVVENTRGAMLTFNAVTAHDLLDSAVGSQVYPQSTEISFGDDTLVLNGVTFWELGLDDFLVL